MAAFNFPNSPSTNDIHTENGISWKWNGTVWKKVASPDTIAKANSKVQVVDAGTGGYVTAETDGTQRIRIQNSGAIVTGVLTATSFVGDGSGITGVASTEHIHAQTHAVVGISTLTGPVSFGGTATFKVNQKLYFNDGANNTFGSAFIYADNYNLIVENANGAGSAYFRGNTCNLQGGGSNKTGIRVSGGSGDVEFFHNDGIIGETHSTGEGGIDIKQSLRHYGDTDTLIEFETNQINFDTAGVQRFDINSSGNLKIGTAAAAGGKLYFESTSGAAQYIASGGTNNGDLLVANSAGEKLRIASNGVVAIGTEKTAGQGSLFRVGTSLLAAGNDLPDGGIIIVPKTGSVITTGQVVPMISAAGEGASPGIARAAIAAVSTNGRSAMDMVFCTRNAGDGTSIDVTDDERLRINSAGDTMFGCTVSRPAEFAHPDGFSIRTDGNKGQFQSTVDANSCGLLNRDSSDGSILSFRREGVDVGHIGVTGSTTYLQFGGTNADAHQLDDYEEGQWTPNLMDGNSSNISFSNGSNCYYTKIGRLVYCYFNVTRAESGSKTGIISFYDLPFTSHNTTLQVTGTWWMDHGQNSGDDAVGGAMYVQSNSKRALFVYSTTEWQPISSSYRYVEFSQWTNGRPIYGSFTYMAQA